MLTLFPSLFLFMLALCVLICLPNNRHNNSICCGILAVWIIPKGARANASAHVNIWLRSEFMIVYWAWMILEAVVKLPSSRHSIKLYSLLSGVVPKQKGKGEETWAHKKRTGKTSTQCTSSDLFRWANSTWRDSCPWKVSLTRVLTLDANVIIFNRARRRKKIAKAIERQARKLRAKGITVDLEALKAEYISQHRGQNISNSSESEDNEEEDPIDVVGVADDSDDDTTEDCSTHTRRDSTDHLINYSSSSEETPKHTIRSNPFSIESLLYRNTWNIT